MTFTAAAALLCGGLSERLNYPKEMLRVDGAPLAVHLVNRLREVFESVAELCGSLFIDPKKSVA